MGEKSCGQPPLSRTAGEGAERSEAGEGLGAERRKNCLEHTLGVGEDVVVPKSDNAPALAHEPFCAPVIGSVLAVLASIRLNDEAVLGAGEVDDERADRVLPPEPVADEASSAQVSPQTDFGIRRTTAQVAGKLLWHGAHDSASVAGDRTRGNTLTRLAALATLSRGAGEGLGTAVRPHA